MLFGGNQKARTPLEKVPEDRFFEIKAYILILF